MPRAIGARELREGARRRAIGHPQVVRETLGPERPPALAGVFVLLDAKREPAIDRARGYGIDPGGQGLCAGHGPLLSAALRGRLYEASVGEATTSDKREVWKQ